MHLRRSVLQFGYATLPLLFGITLVVLAASLTFGFWAFGQMLHYRNDTSIIVSQAVTTAKQQEGAVKDAAFAESEKQPLKTYSGPEAYGSVTVDYPKTWSGYVIDTNNASPFIDGYFYPGVVPDTQSSNSVFSLRVRVEQQAYSSELSQFASFVKNGQTKISPFRPAKVPSVIGARVDGKLLNNKSGSMILIPLRNMTLKIWTEAPQFENDFDTNILPNFTFQP